MTLESVFLKSLQNSRKAKSLLKKFNVSLDHLDRSIAELPQEEAEMFLAEFNGIELQFCRKILEDDFKRVAKSFPKKDRLNVPQSEYQLKGKFGVKDIEKYFGNFEILKRSAILGVSPDSEVFSRDSISAKINHKSKNGLFFLSAVIAGQPVNSEFFETVKNFCKVEGAELRLLPMRGVKKSDELYPLELHDHIESFFTEVKFNENLTAIDMMLYPQQQLPLTGFDRYAQGKSIIVASPKQQLKFVPVSTVGLPHIEHTTGAVTNPENYAHTRAGAMAAKDHKLGGLIVQVVNSKIFHVRQVQANAQGGFQHLGKYYENQKVAKAKAVALIIPDYHCGFHDEQATAAWFRLAEEIEPEHVIFHDLFDGYSISHHHDDDIYTQVNRPEHVKTLELELSCVANELKKWQARTKAQLVVVKSNHDEVIEKWLKKGKFHYDRENYKAGLILANYYINQKLDPLEHYLKDVHGVTGVKFLQRTDEFKLEGVHLGYHGDKGPNGAKGGAKSLSSTLGNCVIGHYHSPQVTHDAWVVGTNSYLSRDYTAGSPSSWFHTACILYKGGQRTLISSVFGKYK